MTDSSLPSPLPTLPQRLEGGTVLGRCVIDGWLRDGGMASLYRGHHAKTGAKVAIKVQLAHSSAELVSAARFEREAMVMGRLSGVPNVAQVHDVDELPDGRHYLVMEWIEGDDLETLLDDLRNADRSMDVERACRIMRDVALALSAVHRAKVVHRDLKPSNIMVDHRRPDREVVKLLDFGISADLGADEGSAELTAAGVVLGTAAYVAPEQALGLPPHPSFDVYAFGVVLFEVLTGYTAPPDGLAPERLPSITALRASVPTALAELVTTCLQRDPSQRPASAEALVERLDAVLGELRRPKEAPPPGAAAEAADEPVGSPDEIASRAPRWAVVAVVVGAIAVPVIGLLASRCEPSGVVEPWEGVGAAAVRDMAPGTHAPNDPPDAGSGSSTAEPTPGGSSSGGGETEAAASTGEPAVVSSTGKDQARNDPKGPTSSEICERARHRALAASRRRDWEAVLRATSDRRCWAAEDQQDDRKAMRVAALAELGRFEQCVAEGTGSTDPRIARRTKLCRMRATKQPE